MPASRQTLWSVSGLAVEFKLDRKTVRARLDQAKCKPDGTQRGSPGYYIPTVAMALLDDGHDQRRTYPDDDEDPANSKNPRTRKEYYEAELKKRELEVGDGLLVPSEDVEAAMSRIVKAINGGLDSLGDVLELEVGLSPDQATRVREIADAIRESVYEELTSGEI